MEKYIGTKLIEAEEMTRAEFLFFTKKITEQEAAKMKSELGYKVQYKDGYVSWSPKDVFENAYRKIDGMNFGLAVEAVKNGLKIARKGWNGKGQFVYYVPGGDYKTQTEIAKKDFGETAHYNPYLAIKTVQGAVSTWVSSINDCLADDWWIIE